MAGNIKFLKDVFHCALGAYGGPEAHYGVFIDILVKKRKYITEEELVEFMALTNFLPGPSSTQTIVAVGYKIGGFKLSLLTFLVWTLPAILLMILLSFSSLILYKLGISKDTFRYFVPMALGFIFFATYAIGKKVIVDRFTFLLSLGAAITILLFPKAYMYPVLLLVGAIISIIHKKVSFKKIKIAINYYLLFAFVSISILIPLASNIINNRIFDLFSIFYKYGYLVIGGGNVVIPMMYTEFVDNKNYISAEQFLSGFGLVQGIPGPMFSFSSYIGTLSIEGDLLLKLFSGILSGIAIFLPGLILLYIILPIWTKMKENIFIKTGLAGMVSVSSGFIFITPFLIIQKQNVDLLGIIISVAVFLLLLTKRISAPIIVLIVFIIGFYF